MILLTLFFCLLSLSLSSIGIKKQSLRDKNVDKIKRIFKYPDYEKFVLELGNGMPEFIAAIRFLVKEKNIKVNSSFEVEARKLKPTQNEIDISKSVFFCLGKDEAATKLILECKKPLQILQQKIVTSNNGQYIIDGHHRWAQVLVCNPKCIMDAVDLPDIRDPFKALKLTQLAIAASKKKQEKKWFPPAKKWFLPAKKDFNELPSNEVGRGLTYKNVAKEELWGTFNLMKITKEDFKTYFTKTILNKVLKVFREYLPHLKTKDDVFDYLWENIQNLQKNNSPIQNAPSRRLMPQTDATEDWENNIPLLR